MFNPKNTFKSFVVGDDNHFAYASALAIAQSPGNSYNPLFLHGGSGLGKTHLLHALGQHVLTNNKGARVAYLSSEEFACEYTDAIRNNWLPSFRKESQKSDALLIDDIQFLADKEQIQEELFYIINSLQKANRQVVMAGNCSSNEIQEFQQRLVTRFEWGLDAGLQSPDFETHLVGV
jgi:chromosomal replication initiator protein